jgi:outer membrane protein TolC
MLFLYFLLLFHPSDQGDAQAQAAHPEAAPVQSAPSLEDLIAEALARSPSLQALEENIKAAREMISPAGALPNPMAETMLQNIGFPRLTIGKEEMSMLNLSLRQNLPYPGKREARRKTAEAESVIAEREYEILKRMLVEDLRRMWAELYTIDNETASLAAARELLDLLAATASSRYASGQTEQEALIKAQMMILKIGAQREELEAMRKKTAAAINRILDRPGGESLGTVGELPELPVPDGSWTEAALLHSPEIAMKKAWIALAERRLKIAELDVLPDFGAATGYGFREGLYPVVTLGFSVEIPFWRKEKQKPMIRAAGHELEMARFDLKAAEAQARSAVAALTADVERYDRQIVRYSDGILPQTSRAMDAALASYISGKGDFSTVVEDFMLWLDARVELARQRAGKFSALAAVSSLTTPAENETED